MHNPVVYTQLFSKVIEVSLESYNGKPFQNSHGPNSIVRRTVERARPMIVTRAAGRCMVILKYLKSKRISC
jgi:hypothetical protein